MAKQGGTCLNTSLALVLRFSPELLGAPSPTDPGPHSAPDPYVCLEGPSDPLAATFATCGTHSPEPFGAQHASDGPHGHTVDRARGDRAAHICKEHAMLQEATTLNIRANAAFWALLRAGLVRLRIHLHLFST